MTLREESIIFNTMNNLKFPELQKASIIMFWETYGGSFLKGLSKALSSADIINERKIRDTFYNYIASDYEAILRIENSLW